MKKNLAITFCLLLLTGCTSLYSSFATHPVDTDHSKRTFGAKFEDGSIKRKSRINLVVEDEAFRDANVEIISYNGTVLLFGEVPNPQLKKKATEIVEKIRGVKVVHNELNVEQQQASATLNDGWITTKTKIRFIMDGNVPGNRINVTTEKGVVYLMGLVTREQANLAVASAQKVYGIKRIVKMFEYIQ